MYNQNRLDGIKGLLDLKLNLEATNSSEAPHTAPHTNSCEAHLRVFIAERHSKGKEYFRGTLKLEAESEFYASAIFVPFVGTFVPRRT